MPPSPPDDLLDRPLLRQLAGEKRFRRGEEYFNEGRVRQIHVAADRITAKVSGTRAYRVKLWRGRGQLLFSCSCALGKEEEFCKHCVAVGLAWLAGPEGQAAQPGVTRDELRDHLRSLDKERLVSLALEAMDYDDILRRRLMLETIGVAKTRKGSRPPETLDLATYRQLLREAIECADYVDYDSMPDYAQGVEEAIRPLRELLRAGRADAVVELAELALVELDKASEMLDGGDGSLNAVYDDLQHYHLEACRQAHPDPEQLAARLLYYEIEGGLGVFNNAATAYAEVLGPVGLAAWRRLLVREWAKLPPLNPPKHGRAQTEVIDHRRFQITALMEQMAAAEGDKDSLALIKQRDLSTAYDFLALAEFYRDNHDLKQTILWAERGLQCFPDEADDAGLRDLLAAAYRQNGEHEKAVALLWEEFARHSDPEKFRRLKAFAESDGEGSWPRWRAKALEQLRQFAARSQSSRPPDQSEADASDRSAVVAALLSAGEEQEAWIEASAGGCHPQLWLRLAHWREKSHPDEALRVYREQLGLLLAGNELRLYPEAIEVMGKIRDLLLRLGRNAEYDTFLAEVRAAHRSKRALLKMLDAMR